MLEKRQIYSIPPNHHLSSLPISIHNHSNLIIHSSNILSFHTARFVSFAFRSACDLSYIPFYFLPSSCSLTKELNYNDLYNQRLRYAFLFLLKNYGIIMILTRTQWLVFVVSLKIFHFPYLNTCLQRPYFESYEFN